MATSDTQFAGSIPDTYDDLMVPMIFEPYAEDLAQRVAAINPHSILETAAGTGVVTRAMAQRLGSSVKIVATDLNPPMLERARKVTGNDPRINWQSADALSLPFPGGAFGCAVCQFGVMFYPDKAKGYAESFRVLAPGGTYVFNVWGDLASNAFVTVLQDTLTKVFADNPTNFMARIPHGYNDLESISAALMAAGFAHVTVETIDRESHAQSALAAATAYCQGTPLRSEIEQRNNPDLAQVTQIVAEAFQDAFGSGPIKGAIRAHVFTAVK